MMKRRYEYGPTGLEHSEMQEHHTTISAAGSARRNSTGFWRTPAQQSPAPVALFLKLAFDILGFSRHVEVGKGGLRSYDPELVRVQNLEMHVLFSVHCQHNPRQQESKLEEIPVRRL